MSQNKIYNFLFLKRLSFRKSESMFCVIGSANSGLGWSLYRIEETKFVCAIARKTLFSTIISYFILFLFHLIYLLFVVVVFGGGIWGS